MSVDAAIQQMVQQTVQAMLPQIVQAVQGQLGSGAGNVGVQQNTGMAGLGMDTSQQGINNGAGLNQQVQQQVTPEMIQSLVAALVNDEAKKQRIIQEMQAMGIRDLPEIRTDQLPEFYQRLCKVRDEGSGVQQQGGGFGGMSLTGGAAQQGGGTSII